MLDYDREAETYDATRGGEERAAAAATAIEQLLPPSTRTLVDLACGTGIVTRRLLQPDRHPARRVVGLDRSPGMLRSASRRLPQCVVLADATRLPIETASVDAVVIVWLLHLLSDAADVLGEAARVLRPGGVVITTVDKNQAWFAVPSDLADLTRSVREPKTRTATDRLDRILTQAAEHDLRMVGETTFPGTGQGRSPQQWQQKIRTGATPWFTQSDAETLQVANLNRALATLPDQHSPRPDPLYHLVALA